MVSELDTYESALLGCILLEPNTALYACKDNRITVNSFLNMDARVVFSAMNSLAKTNRPIDIITVERELSQPIKLSLSKMMDYAVTVAHVNHYAEEVKNAERFRIFSGMLAKTERDLAQNIPLAEAMAEMQATLIELSDTSGVQALKLKDLREAKIAQWKTAKDVGFVGVPFTLPSINRSLGGWRNGCVGIIAGYRGEGKSSLVRQQCLDLANRGYKVALFSLEDPADIATACMVGNQANISVFSLDTGRCSSDKIDEMDKVWQQMGDIPFWIISGALGIDEIDTTTRLLKMKHDIDIIFIDHVQYITPLILRGMSRNDTMAHYSSRASSIAKTMDIPVIFASQLSRSSEKENRKPRLSDLRDSGTLEQDARQILMLYYDADKEHHVIELAKNNFGESRVEIDVKRVDGRQRFEEVV